MPLALDLSPGVRTMLLALWRVLLAAVALALLQTVTGAAGRVGDELAANVLTPGIPAVAAVLCFARSRLVATDRGAWLAMSLGLALWACAELYWAVVFNGVEDIPYPSPADALWLAFYVTSYVSLTFLIRARVTSFQPSMWLDGLIAALGAAGLVVALVFRPLLEQTDGSVSVVATNLAYPLGDLLLIAMVAGMFALAGWRPERAWLWLAAGLVANAIGDVIYLHQVALGTYVEGSLLDMTWLVAVLFIAGAAWRRPNHTERDLEGWPALVVPLLFTLSSLGVLVYGNVANLPTLALVLSAAATVCAVVRTALAFRELRSLADSRRRALTDDLTGLRNRRAFHERLQSVLREPEETSPGFAVMVIDLDRFKDLNDALGHHAGDLVLQRIGPRMREALRDGDTLARLGGDEFGVLLEGGVGRQELASIAGRMRAELQQPFHLDGVAVSVDASIGIALAPEHGTAMEGLLQRADVAMYEAKKTGGGCEIYSPERDHHSRERLALMTELRSAISSDQLFLHYQPKADLRTGRVVGVEALVRWAHPTRGLLAPGEFIPMAEQTGLMGPLTLRVMDAALRQAADWHHAGLELGIAINLSASNLDDPDLSRKIERLLTRWGVAPELLQLEITEDVLMTDTGRAENSLRALRELGVEISLDDFGTGYSSLAYLRHLPVDELKLDRSFVTDIATDERATQIVGSVIMLARELGLRVVAEGVETAAGWSELAGLGCDLAQGYFLARPLPAEELERWLAERGEAVGRAHVATDGPAADSVRGGQSHAIAAMARRVAG